MVTSTATGLVALCLVLVFWVTVQHAWHRVFGVDEGDPDALAGRLGCHGICERDECARPCRNRTGAAEEEDR